MSNWPAPPASGPVHGRVVIPGSKSASARSLLLAALADGPCTLSGVLDSRDTQLMRAGLHTLGATFTEVGTDALRIDPITAIRGGGSIDVGLSGTVLRFLPPIAALAQTPTGFFGDPEVSARPIAPLLDALAGLGAHVKDRKVPFTVSGGDTFRGGAVSIDAHASSQFISALLLSGARFPEGLQLSHHGDSLPSRPHIDMTCTLLARHQVEVRQPDENTWEISPGTIAALDERIEPDLTNAATMLAAALVTGGSLSTLWPSDSVQAADQLAEVLTAFGGRLRYLASPEGRFIEVTGPQTLAAVDLDLSEISEITPVAAALAALASGPSRLRGVGHIRGHETDRLAALSTELSRLGAGVSTDADSIVITPGIRHGGVFATYADHRLAHAGALIGLVTDGIELDDVSCTTKTLPDFPGLWHLLVRTAS